MKLNTPQEYKITLSRKNSYQLRQGNELVKFSAPATKRGIAKLYVVSLDQRLLYVGIAKQPMASRINYGLKAKGKGGYHGYKWKGLKRELSLTVWTATSGTSGASLREMETIEAEVAFLCRQNSSQWPEYQNEIHFFQSSAAHRNAAETIYRHATQSDG